MTENSVTEADVDAVLEQLEAQHPEVDHQVRSLRDSRAVVRGILAAAVSTAVLQNPNFEVRHDDAAADGDSHCGGPIFEYVANDGTLTRECDDCGQTWNGGWTT